MTQPVIIQSSSDIGDSRQGPTKNSAAFVWCLPNFVRETVLNLPDNGYPTYELFKGVFIKVFTATTDTTASTAITDSSVYYTNNICF